MDDGDASNELAFQGMCLHVVSFLLVPRENHMDLHTPSTLSLSSSGKRPREENDNISSTNAEEIVVDDKKSLVLSDESIAIAPGGEPQTSSFGSSGSLIPLPKRKRVGDDAMAEPLSNSASGSSELSLIAIVKSEMTQLQSFFQTQLGPILSQLQSHGQQLASQGLQLQAIAQQSSSQGLQLQSLTQQSASQGQQLASQGQQLASQGQQLQTLTQQSASQGLQLQSLTSSVSIVSEDTTLMKAAMFPLTLVGGGPRACNVLSVLYGAHGVGRGIFSFLTLRDANNLRLVCQEMKREVTAFPWND